MIFLCVFAFQFVAVIVLFDAEVILSLATGNPFASAPMSVDTAVSLIDPCLRQNRLMWPNSMPNLEPLFQRGMIFRDHNQVIDTWRRWKLCCPICNM